MRYYHVYGMGNALLDIEFEVELNFLEQNSIEKGVMTLVDETRQSLILGKLGFNNCRKMASGGSAANAMFAIQHSGSRGFYTCKIANDEAGDHYYGEMKEAGLACNFDTQERMPGHTGKCLAMVTADADRSMNTFLGISETLSKTELNPKALAHSEYLYIEGYLMSSASAFLAVKEAQEIAKQHQVKIALSLSDPAFVKIFRSQFKEILSFQIDLLFCNEEEALEFTESTSLEQAVGELKKYARQFIVTRGELGSIAYDGNLQHYIHAKKVKAIDTLGAGDTYAGIFLAAITQGRSFVEAGKMASAAAAKVVTRFGPRLTKDEIQYILQQENQLEKI